MQISSVKKLKALKKNILTFFNEKNLEFEQKCCTFAVGKPGEL